MVNIARAWWYFRIKNELTDQRDVKFEQQPHPLQGTKIGDTHGDEIVIEPGTEFEKQAIKYPLFVPVESYLTVPAKMLRRHPQ